MSQVINLNSNTKSKTQKLAGQKYEPGTQIAALDSGVWQVDQGVVQLSRLGTDGNEVIVGFVTANSTFEKSLSSLSRVVSRATALSDVYVKYYSQQDIAESSMLARRLLATEARSLEDKFQIATGLIIN